ncbi:ankyrin repeat-containing domain protein [Cantharellus anzutake]|uniref:ankyrin repeat-containing domain protein n=1 Tax=Cantharellus anzutake TaxID=1750568 RepID=UPI0019044A41|nr:ankyrin repeat-containing domain protein [Cantharellus anzutake]KAF8340646.1 ankyrin repeat-containing domain protein [Cantharellus anzutake]
MPASVSTSRKNLWIAASDGDLEPHFPQGMSPNDPDPNTYTPMHAAASYGRLNILDYLISRGGDVNVTDEDGDTPLYTVESVEAAKYLVDHGALSDRRNNDGVLPEEHLEEDFPEIAEYLRGLSREPRENSLVPPTKFPSQMATEQASERLTQRLMADVEQIMARSDLDGTDIDEVLRQAVEQIVIGGIEEGHTMMEEQTEELTHAEPSKRQRRDEGEDK